VINQSTHFLSKGEMRGTADVILTGCTGVLNGEINHSTPAVEMDGK
jgi:hypothetical protein